MQVPVVLTNANQSFTDTQKAQGRTNIGAAAAADLQTEISNRSTADTTINNRISTLATNLSTEITNRTNADTTLLFNIDNEASARTNADTTINNRISTLATNLSTEISDREAADTAINAAKQDKITATTTTLTANVDLTQGQCEVTFNLSSGRTSVVTFDIYIDVSTSSTDAHPLIEILNGTTVLDNFYSSIGSTTGSVSRVHYASYSKVFSNLSSVTVRMHYGTYLLNGGTFAVNMTKVEI